MIEIEDKRNCSGCHSCCAICPLQCISMEPDREGFWYPRVDAEVCTECGLCVKACPIISPTIHNSSVSAFACINRNEEIREKSSSGGVFSLIAEAIITRKGIVFGAGFDKNFDVVHGWTDSIEGLSAFRGSKYVQSRIGNALIEVQEFLKAGRPVLFSGTPCQIAGLRSYLGKDYENLLCIDIVCHGVPSPRVWQRYKKELEERNRAKVKRIAFRRKDCGWKLFSVSFSFDNDTEYSQPLTNDIYMKGFLSNLYLRPSCYACHFKSLNRPSDITLADFWGIESVLPHMDDDKGTSLVLVHTEKGAAMLADLAEKIICEKVDVNKAISFNSAAVKSVAKNSKREEFFAELDNAEDVIVLIDRYTKVSATKKAYSRVRGLLGKVKRRVMG